MSILEALTLKPKQWVNAVILCLGTLAPGTLVICYFRPDWFIALDAIKLCLLAFALTLPLVLMSMLGVLPRVLMRGKLNPESSELVDPGELYLAACMASGVALYPALALTHFLHLSFNHFCMVTLCLAVLIAIWNWAQLLRKCQR